jgi:glycosyltransferase involved in cell wall biosynthesis
MEGEEMLSCIMPTHNRRPFVPQAIRYFLRQSYDPKELIVIDDGSDPVGDLCAVDGRIRYVRLEEKRTLGAKRNLACRLAKGQVIAHWDDDDWQADRRLRCQVEALGQADICGLDRVLFFDPAAGAAWQYLFPGTLRPWVHGATLCYKRSYWEANPFADIDVGEDLRFVWNDPDAKIVAIEENRFMAALVHPGNVSIKKTGDDCWSEVSFADIRALIGTDWGFYSNLANAGPRP